MAEEKKPFKGRGSYLKNYWLNMTPEQKKAHAEKAAAAANIVKRAKAEARAKLYSETKAVLSTASFMLPEVDKPDQLAIDKVIELAQKRFSLKRIRAAFPLMSDKSWKNLTSYAFKSNVSDAEQAAMMFQNAASAHQKVLKKRIKVLKEDIALWKKNNPDKPVPGAMREMLFAAEDQHFKVESDSIQNSHRVGAFDGKKNKGSSGVLVKFNVSRPLEKTVEPAIEAVSVRVPSGD